MPDRIEAGTYLLAGAVTRGDVTITRMIPEHVKALCDTLAEMGFTVETGKDRVRVAPPKKLAGSFVKTLPYPGFPTDLQAPFMSLLTTVPGISVISETIFENRYTHVGELRRMGASIEVEGNVAVVKGGKRPVRRPGDDVGPPGRGRPGPGRSRGEGDHGNPQNLSFRPRIRKINGKVILTWRRY